MAIHDKFKLSRIELLKVNLYSTSLRFQQCRHSNFHRHSSPPMYHVWIWILEKIKMVLVVFNFDFYLNAPAYMTFKQVLLFLYLNLSSFKLNNWILELDIGSYTYSWTILLEVEFLKLIDFIYQYFMFRFHLFFMLDLIIFLRWTTLWWK